MALFQNSVQDKYIKQLDTSHLQARWALFTAYFHNTEIQENIRNSKEEQFQEGFLRELFVNILGYTLNPSPNYNLTTELKNIKDAKKADGAVLHNGEAIAVIELKGTDTTDLTKVETQAFGYKNNHRKVDYIIISNFEKLNFYINNTQDVQEFNLFKLTFDDFKLLYLCLAYNHILSGLSKKIKEESLSEENKITKELYHDYSDFKNALFANLCALNPGYDALVLYKSTQKLLDRLLFIFFAEDRNLLPPNFIRQIITDWRTVKRLDIDEPLYTRFKKNFGYLNTGRKEAGLHDIFAYNGGLFLPDAVLDNVLISDDVLLAHSEKLAEYDFESEVDVNILGHIFENSLNGLDEVKAQLEGREVDKSKTKRKKDGVFYTPKYITKYIVDNTVGRLCTEKKAELQIVDADYTTDKKRNATTKKTLDAKLEGYRQWLLQITIVDPACGSGAFLNQALEFLIAEHRYIDELRAKLLGYGLVLSDVENSILENNLFGVDINEESVDIAKLSLWLRTARPNRKLNNLNNNIKCGNSLIDDPAVAGDKAFNWQTEFADVFARGGFDVVIGNPPYVKLETIKEASESLSKLGYKTFEKRGDLYVLFVEKGFNILKDNGKISFIMPNKWLQAGYGKPLRELFLTQRLISFIDFGDLQIFEGATTYPCIFISEKCTPLNQVNISVLTSDKSIDFLSNISINQQVFDLSKFSGDTWIISSSKEKDIIVNLQAKYKSLSDTIGGYSYRGILTGLSEAFCIDNNAKDQISNGQSSPYKILKPFLLGRDVSSYSAPETSSYLILFEKGFTKSLQLSNEEEGIKYLKENYEPVLNWLLPFEERAKKRTDKGDYWWELRACDYYNKFEKPKIMYQAFQVKPCFIYDESGLYCNNSMWFIPTDNKGLVAILNSKMGWWLISKFCTQIQNGYQLIWKYFGQIPIPNISDVDNPLIAKADEMLRLNKELQEASGKFTRNLMREFNLATLPGKLQNWYTLTYAEFLKELTKLKITLTLSQKAEWEDYFTKEQSAAAALTNQIATTDKAIDQMVYALYELTEEELKIVEAT